MPRTFEMKVYGTGGTTPSQNAINQRNASIEAQNKLAKSGGAGTITVPQTSQVGTPVSPTNSNTNTVGLANAMAKADSINAYNGCSGQPASSCSPTTGGRTRRRRRYKKKRRTIYGYRK